MKPRITALAATCLLVIMAPIAAETKGSYFAVIVSDIRTSAEWYKSTFGLASGAPLSEPGRYTIVNLQKQGIFVELLEIEAAGERPETRVHGPFKVGVLVSNLSEFVAQLPDAIPEPKVILDTRNSLRLIQLHDPDGNTIQIMEILDSSTE